MINIIKINQNLNLNPVQDLDQIVKNMIDNQKEKTVIVIVSKNINKKMIKNKISTINIHLNLLQTQILNHHHHLHLVKKKKTL